MRVAETHIFEVFSNSDVWHVRFQIRSLAQTSDLGSDVYLSARFLETSDPRSDVSQQEMSDFESDMTKFGEHKY